jgi:type I restriction enzyme S subunit
MASGATPKVAEEEKFYSSRENGGIPFIRVQNLKETSELHLEEIKYINNFANSIYLKRSQVKEGNLLTKITGVGRMAVSAVAPIGFIGNINQHIVVSKTNGFKESEILAAYLNSDIGEKLASRRATGGTRPALDYPALRSIPIIFKAEIVDVLKKGVTEKKKKEQKSEALLKNIDEYLLKMLGVKLLDQNESTIENRMFRTGWQKLTGNRFDPKKYSINSENLITSIENSTQKKVPLKSLITHSVAGDWGLDENEKVNEKLYSKCLVIRATEFDNNYNLNIENSRAKYRLISKIKLKKLDILPNDLLLEKSGGSPDQPVGRIAILENNLLDNNTIAYSNFIHKFRVNTEVVLPEFLFCFLKTIHNIKLTDVMQSQTNGIRNLIMREYWNQSIILPNKTKQKEIAETIYQMREEANRIEADARIGFEITKKDIEKLILK